MNLKKALRVAHARTPFDALSIVRPRAAELLKLRTVALLPTELQKEVWSVRGRDTRLTRAYVDAPGRTPEEKALNAYLALWGGKK